MASGGFHGLVDGSCGSANPLMRLTTHLTEDKAKVDFLRTNGLKTTDPAFSLRASNLHSGQVDFAEEFLQQQQQPSRVLGPVTSFNMKSLLREIQQPKMQQRFDNLNQLDKVRPNKLTDSFPSKL